MEKTTFHDETVFDPKEIMNDLKEKLDLLSSSTLLQPYQKLCVISSFICPTLIYNFQNTPLKQIPSNFLKDTDILIKSVLKDILQLPADIPDSMLYSEIKCRGLGLFKAKWEAFLQKINACLKLKGTNNMYINHSKNNFDHEINDCLQKLNINTTDILNTEQRDINVRKVRKKLREQEFEKWCSLPQKGKGVVLYKNYTTANSWINKTGNLTSSEWKEAIKMSCNICAVRAIPGRSQDGTHCRHCPSEKETLGHVLGSCPHGELLRNTRHHRVRSLIAKALREKHYSVFEEVHGVSDDGSTRRIDMIAFQDTNKGWIIDPTIRMESHADQPIEVHNEKCSIYNATISYYKNKYQLKDIVVLGLMVGARGTITSQFVQFCRQFNLDKNFIKEIAISTLRDSITILKNHLYGLKHV